MIISKIALCVLVMAALVFLGLFLWGLYIDWKYEHKDADKSEV